MQIIDKPRRQIFINVLFVPCDFWVGLYIGTCVSLIGGWHKRSFYLCLLPMLPIVISFYKIKKNQPRT